MLKVGNARIDITPQEGSAFYLLGFKTPLRDKPAAGIHDHIFGNSLLVQTDGGSVFLWTADLLELEDAMVADVKARLSAQFGMSPEHVVLGTTHDHSSVRDYHKTWEFGAFSQAYYDFLVESILESYRLCLQNLRTATAAYGRRLVTGYYSNRNHPGQLADNEVIVLRFLGEDGKPFAGIVNWAVHSTALGASNQFLTGDLAGGVCRKLGETWGYFPVMLNGAAGDSSNRNDRRGKDFAELERECAGLAAAIAAISADTSIDLETGGIRSVLIPCVIAPDAEQNRRRFEKTIAALTDGTLRPAGDFPTRVLVEKCEEQLKNPTAAMHFTMQALDVGRLRFFVFPGELGSKFGRELKASTQKLALVAGYANGFHHYFLAQEDYGISFETIGNFVPPGETEKLVASLIAAGARLDARQ